jgi:hypothetical protein
VILGFRALRDIRLNAGQMTGRRLAFAGMVTGALGSVFVTTLIVLAVEKMRDAGDRSK